MVKVSIRASVLILFTALLMAVGSVIMFVNYIAGESVLLKVAQGLVYISYNNVSERITSFLQPLNERIDIGVRTINEGLVTPAQDEKFTKFLLQILGDSPNLFAIHWTDPQGDFNYIERNNDGTFLQEKILCTSYCAETEQKIDKYGKTIAGPELVTKNFDPKVRPWYIKATQEKHYILSDLYVFYYRPEVGVTASYPIYDNTGKLRGILSIDETLRSLSNFVSNLRITKNSNVFIFTGNYDLVAARELQKFNGGILPKVNSIAIPWVQESFKIYKSSKKDLFLYKYKGDYYLAYYQTIHPIVHNPWYIAIGFPMSDVTSALRENLTTSALIAALILLFGMLLISMISKAISRPIVSLAEEAILIEQMNLSQVVPLPISRIKEINFMQETFSAMKQSLASFIRYVPAALVKKLIASGDVAHVGGENKEVTFLFSDIKNFTSLSENVEPQELMKYLSEYFQVMTKVVLANQGTVDKYIGDAIMAFWGAPLDDEEHVSHACRCAIKMQEELLRLNEKWRKEGVPTIGIRIGINTGIAIIGNVGSEDRLSYTALGDTVNLASRLEELNKVYRTKIIVGDNTYQKVKDHFDFRLLDQVVVRGKNKSGYVYELLTETSFFRGESKVYETIFSEAFALYQKGEWEKASDIFEKLESLFPGDNLAWLYLERCKNFKITPPKQWDGIWRIS